MTPADLCGVLGFAATATLLLMALARACLARAGLTRHEKP